MSKQVAQSIKDMASGEAMTAVLDRGQDVADVLKTLKEHWAYDLYERKPGPALLENGVFTPTDLDLACFMSALADRHAVISLPHYEAARARTKTEGEHVVSKNGRHGKIMGLTANKEVFSFSVRINDMNVVSTDGDGNEEIGAPRNFMLVGVDGKWWKGWDRIEFMPNRAENDFLLKNKLWTGNTVHFTNFVHPNRWTSFYGQYYLLTKALVARLTEEASFCRAEAKRIAATGIKLPPVEPSPKSEKAGADKPITVAAFEVELDAPFTGSFKPFEADLAGYNAAKERARILSYNEVPILTFAVRATELAFHNKGREEAGFPTWIKGAKWENGYRVSEKSRTDWQRLVFAQRKVGELGVALRYRVYDKTERIAV